MEAGEFLKIVPMPACGVVSLEALGIACTYIVYTVQCTYVYLSEPLSVRLSVRASICMYRSLNICMCVYSLHSVYPHDLGERHDTEEVISPVQIV